MAGATPAIGAAMSVSLDPSVPAPAPVGAPVTWTATVSDASSGTLWYRFRTRLAGTEIPRVVRDYGPSNTLVWTASEHEGAYEIEVSVQNKATAETAATAVIYQVTSCISGNTPVISETANPLVFLYSAPACPVGSRMRVEFEPANAFLARIPRSVSAPNVDASIQNTPYKGCQPGQSMNFYLAGMRPNTEYSVKHIVETGSEFQDGPVLSLTTPDVSLPIAGYSVLMPPQTPIRRGILLQSTVSQFTVATDLYGNLVWFYPGNITYITRPAPGGFFFLIAQKPSADASQQILREIDLAGTPILETNAARINEQLLALGKRQITGFHHEVRRLPNGKILVLASTEQILTDVQGPGPVDILGDMILVLDRDLQVVWTWDAFDHLDPHRPATLGETCTQIGGGCPPFFLAPRANDWLHGNSLQLTPDGNILYSIRHQDWVIKIDYSNGQGSGDIMWRLGKDGDFQINSSDPFPWFSHQHDAEYEFNNGWTLTVFDNGNLRYEMDPDAHSRGQVLRLDERNRVADLVLNADLGAYSNALGSAQRLPNGRYHFDVGWIRGGNTSRSVEVDSSGSLVYSIQVATTEYRSFRMRDLYTP